MVRQSRVGGHLLSHPHGWKEMRVAVIGAEETSRGIRGTKSIILGVQMHQIATESRSYEVIMKNVRRK